MATSAPSVAAAEGAQPRVGDVGRVRSLGRETGHVGRRDLPGDGLACADLAAGGVAARARLVGHAHQRVQLVALRAHLEAGAELLASGPVGGVDRGHHPARGVRAPAGEDVEPAGEVAQRRRRAPVEGHHAPVPALHRGAQDVGAVEAALHEVRAIDHRARGEARQREELEPAGVGRGHAAVDPGGVGRAEDELLHPVAVGVDVGEAAGGLDVRLVSVDARPATAAGRPAAASPPPGCVPMAAERSKSSAPPALLPPTVPASPARRSGESARSAAAISSGGRPLPRE